MGWLNKLDHIRADRLGGGGGEELWGEHSKQTCTVYHGKASYDTGCDSGEADTTEVPLTAYCDSRLLSCSWGASSSAAELVRKFTQKETGMEVV